MITGKKAVIFDFDGTLVDSLWVWDRLDELVFGNRKLQLLAIKNTIASTNLDHFINEFVMR
jgi:beta-phosphoglucomutase-like phosphatase (HAD superfamily)